MRKPHPDEQGCEPIRATVVPPGGAHEHVPSLGISLAQRKSPAALKLVHVIHAEVCSVSIVDCARPRIESRTLAEIKFETANISARHKSIGKVQK